MFHAIGVRGEESFKLPSHAELGMPMYTCCPSILVA
jgi:hypothetical protein